MGEELTAAIVAAAVSAAVALAVAVAQLRQGRQTQRAQAQLDVTAKYDRMVDYRLAQPQVLGLARRWERECFDWIYDHTGPDGDAWAIYYGYIELITFYCTAVLHARARGLLDDDVYESQHEPLIRLLLAEHHPIFSSIIRPSGYVSQYLVRHVRELREADWDWEQKYLDLVVD
jgi:hypothetical protein